MCVYIFVLCIDVSHREQVLVTLPSSRAKFCNDKWMNFPIMYCLVFNNLFCDFICVAFILLNLDMQHLDVFVGNDIYIYICICVHNYVYIYVYLIY